MKRYYLSTMKLLPGPGGQKTLAPALAAYPGVEYTAVYQAVPVAGQWCMVVLQAADHTALLADPDSAALPDFSLDAKLSALSVSAKQSITNALSKFSISGASTKNTDSYRTTIESIGRKLDATFTANAFDAGV